MWVVELLWKGWGRRAAALWTGKTGGIERELTFMEEFAAKFPSEEEARAEFEARRKFIRSRRELYQVRQV